MTKNEGETELLSSVSNSSAVHQLYQQQARQVQEQTAAQQGTKGFGPDFEIALSDDALAHLSGGETAFTELSEKEQKELDNLFKQIDQLFEKVGDTKLTAEQEKQLEALEKKVDSILGPIEDDFDPFEGLSEEEAQKLEGLFSQIDKIFETAGDKPLSAVQEKQLESLENKIDDILGPIEDAEELELYDNLPDAAKKQLDALFDQMDKIFERAGDAPLTQEQEKQLEALEKKVDTILGPPEGDFDPFEGLSDKALQELDSLFGQIDKMFGTTQNKSLNDEQEKQLTLLERRINTILGE